jgi:hypothetical protein
MPRRQAGSQPRGTSASGRFGEPYAALAEDARVTALGEHVGHGDGDRLSFTPITGGTVDGPLLRGTVVPGGGDWAVTRGEVSELNARYLLRADDGALIDIVNRGYYKASPEVVARAERGEPVDPSEYDFRSQPVFRTDAPAHRWLAETVFVGLLHDAVEQRQVHVRVYAVR